MNDIKQQKDATGIVFVLTGFGLGDLFNFGFHILPGVLKKYQHVHIVVDHEENIFKYESSVVWYSSLHNQMCTQVEDILKEDANTIDKVMYLDNHEDFVVTLKDITEKYLAQLYYPSRALIEKLVNTEEKFYFNIYIKMMTEIDPSIPQTKGSIKLYGNTEDSTRQTYLTEHNISIDAVSIIIIPESRKKIKSLSREALSELIEWFTSSIPQCNIFVVSRKPAYLMQGVYYLDSSTVHEVCCFIDKSNICASVDTGFIHAANFLNKNIVGLFGPTNGKSSLYLQENVLEISNLVQRRRCIFHEKIVYKNPCVQEDKCIHNE